MSTRSIKKLRRYILTIMPIKKYFKIIILPIIFMDQTKSTKEIDKENSSNFLTSLEGGIRRDLVLIIEISNIILEMLKNNLFYIREESIKNIILKKIEEQLKKNKNNLREIDLQNIIQENIKILNLLLKNLKIHENDDYIKKTKEIQKILSIINNEDFIIQNIFNIFNNILNREKKTLHDNNYSKLLKEFPIKKYQNAYNENKKINEIQRINLIKTNKEKSSKFSQTQTLNIQDNPTYVYKESIEKELVRRMSEFKLGRKEEEEEETNVQKMLEFKEKTEKKISIIKYTKEQKDTKNTSSLTIKRHYRHDPYSYGIYNRQTTQNEVSQRITTSNFGETAQKNTAYYSKNIDTSLQSSINGMSPEETSLISN